METLTLTRTRTREPQTREPEPEPQTRTECLDGWFTLENTKRFYEKVFMRTSHASLNRLLSHGRTRLQDYFQIIYCFSPVFLWEFLISLLMRLSWDSPPGVSHKSLMRVWLLQEESHESLTRVSWESLIWVSHGSLTTTTAAVDRVSWQSYERRKHVRMSVLRKKSHDETLTHET